MNKNKEMSFADAFVAKIETFFRTKKIFVWIVCFIIIASIIFLFIFNAHNKTTIENSTLKAEEAQEDRKSVV